MWQQKTNIQFQRGAVLIIGLIMLLLLTMIGLASIRGSDLQERMAGNMRERNVAFQSAEAGLRTGEDFLSFNAGAAPVFTGATVGLWPDLNKAGAMRSRPAAWTSVDWEANGIQLPDDTIDFVKEQPRYTIERVIATSVAASQGGAIDHESVEKTADAEYYRVTSQGSGGNTDTEVILQSTFMR